MYYMRMAIHRRVYDHVLRLWHENVTSLKQMFIAACQKLLLKTSLKIRPRL